MPFNNPNNFTQGSPAYPPDQGTLHILGVIPNAIGDGVTDNTLIIQQALTQAGLELDSQQTQGLAGRGQLILPAGTYKISSTLTVPNGVTLMGETKATPYPNRISGFRSNNNLFTGTEIVCSDNFVGDFAIALGPDNTNVENIILDGHSIACGTAYTQINVLTSQGRFISTAFIKFPVHDADDFRVQSLKFDNVEIPAFRLGEYSEFYLQPIGGTGNYTITATGLPNGLTVATDGLISGTATAYGTYFPSFTVNDGVNSIVKPITMGVILDEILTRDINLPTVGAAYSEQLLSRNSVAGNTWSATGLPSWLTLSSTGLLTNSRTTTADDVSFFTFQIILKNGSNVLDRRAIDMELRYADGAIRIYAEQRNKPQQNVAFSYQYKGNGGYGSYTWSINVPRSTISGNATAVTSTSPFTGLTLNTSTGVVSGTATTLGTNTFYLRATSTVNTAIFYESLFYLEVIKEGSTPKIYSRSFKTAAKGQPYSFQFNIENSINSNPRTYTAINLPTGLTMDSATGLITGTPTGANFVNGVEIRWSDSVKNCTIRGFKSGAGIYTKDPSNVHIIAGCKISACDSGIQSVAQTYDSHWYDLYIYNCRVGLDLGDGSAGITVTNSRIEYIHEDGVNIRRGKENDFSSVYFDTCGWSSIRATGADNLLVTGCRFYRSGRNIRGIGTKLNPRANRDYSNHVYLEDNHRTTFTGNSFDIGTKDGGDGIYLSDHFADNVRPYIGFRLLNTHELSIVGNNLTGCVLNAFDSNLTDFGENTFKGYNIANNTQTDVLLQPLAPELAKDTFYLPNQCFQVWQRDKEFNIPASTDGTAHDFPIADGWTIKRGGNVTVNQITNVKQMTDGVIGNGYYLRLSKPANTTPSSTQTLELNNSLGTKLSDTSGRSIILSYYAKSANNTSMAVKVSQYADSADNSFASYQFTDNNRTITSGWKRYQHYFELENLADIRLGANAIFNITFFCNVNNQIINIDLTGVQIDYVDQAPFAQKLREASFETELAFAQLRYQKSKSYTQYFPSWSSGYRYDVNGANFQPGYLVGVASNTTGAQLSTTVAFENPILVYPGNPDSSAGILPYLKILNPSQLTSRTSATKYHWAGTNTVAAYIDAVSKRGFKVSARGASPNAENYSIHWIYTTYATDINAIGGGYA